MKNINVTHKYLKSTSHIVTKYSTTLFTKDKKHTLQFNNNNHLDDNNLLLFKPVEPKHRKDIKKYFLIYSKSEGRELFLKKNLGLRNYYIDNLKKLFLQAQYVDTDQKTSTLHNLVNANFLRKERIYTKLKYSRTPGYDIVSGGAAVILAGFLGFLVSEKFGIELADSGDFYYLWMYGVFTAFSLRPLLTFASKTQSVTSLFSLRHILNFYNLILNIILKVIKNNFNK